MIIGGGVNALASLVVRWDFFQPYLAAGEFGEFFAAFLWMGFLGFTMSVIAQAGFFAYLTLHQVGMNLFRTLTLWNWVQMLLILIVLVDIVVFRFAPRFRNNGRLDILYWFVNCISWWSDYNCHKKSENVRQTTCTNFNNVLYDCCNIIRMDYRLNGTSSEY